MCDGVLSLLPRSSYPSTLSPFHSFLSLSHRGQTCNGQGAQNGWMIHSSLNLFPSFPLFLSPHVVTLDQHFFGHVFLPFFSSSAHTHTNILCIRRLIVDVCARLHPPFFVFMTRRYHAPLHGTIHFDVMLMLDVRRLPIDVHSLPYLFPSSGYFRSK